MARVKKRGRKWYAIYTDERGQRKVKAGFTDKAATLRMAVRLEVEARAIRLGEVDPQVKQQRAERGRPVAEHLEQFRAHMSGKRRSMNHIEYTIRDCQLCFAHAGVETAAALTRQMVDRWRAHCLDTGYPTRHHRDGDPVPDSRKTSNRRVASVRAFLKFLVGAGVLDKCVTDGLTMVDVRGHETRTRRALTREEADRLIAGTPDAHRALIYQFAILTGLRRSEIASLTTTSFDFTNRTIRVIAADAKNKSKDQFVPIHSRLMEPLRALCQTKKPGEPVFNVPHKNDVVAILRADCVAAGVDPKDVEFHGLRHTFCSLLAEQGVRPEVLMKLARHESLSTTMAYYVHFRPDSERDAIERL